MERASRLGDASAVDAARSRARGWLEDSLARFAELRTHGPLPADAADAEKRAAAALERIRRRP